MLGGAKQAMGLEHSLEKDDVTHKTGLQNKNHKSTKDDTQNIPQIAKFRARIINVEMGSCLPRFQDFAFGPKKPKTKQ